MGGPNLEVFKFGMYIFFPIGWMYYFGTNLDQRFSVPDFWPAKNETNQVPFEREEIVEELARLKARRLDARARRMAVEGGSAAGEAVSGETEEGKGEKRRSVYLRTLEGSKGRNGTATGTTVPASTTGQEREGSRQEGEVLSGKSWFKFW